jgi:hypothetical protein
MPGVITTRWVSGAEASRTTGYGRAMLDRLVAEGRVAVFQVPGMPRRYSRGDLDALLAAHTQIAKAQAR